MSEDAFERFRRLRDVPRTVDAGVQTQPTEDTATTAMSPLALFHTLHACGVRLTPYPDGMLRYKAPKGTLTPALLDALREHKEALLDMAEWYEERAGLLEYGTGQARAEVEREAWTQLEARYGRRE